VEDLQGDRGGHHEHQREEHKDTAMVRTPARLLPLLHAVSGLAGPSLVVEEVTHSQSV
jgi:hypothetical protein